MVKLSNGHSFKYMVASGALAFDGKGWPWERVLVWLGLIKPQLFTVVIKSLTRNPRKGNLRWWKPWTCVRLIPGGAVNKVGLTNPGIDWWCERVAPHLDFYKFPIVGSIFGDEKELVEMAGILNRFDLVALEINVSCPNTGHAMEMAEMVVNSVKAVKAVSIHPIIVKVSVDQDYLSIARGLHGFAEAISLNSVPWKTAFPNGDISPLWILEKRVGGGGGGVSGEPAQEYNWRAVEALAKQGALPVIGPSIMEYDDLGRVRELGASAVSFGAIHLRTPWKPTAFVKKGHQYYYCTNGKKQCNEHKSYLREKDAYELVADILGNLAISERKIELMYKSAKERIGADNGYVDQAIQTLQKQLESLTTKESRLLDTYLAEQISKELYDQRILELHNERASLKKQKKELELKQPAFTLEPIKNVFLQANKSRNEFLEGNDETKREVVKSLLWNLSIKDKNVASIKYKVPFDIIAKSPKKGSIYEMLRG